MSDATRYTALYHDGALYICEVRVVRKHAISQRHVEDKLSLLAYLGYNTGMLQSVSQLHSGFAPYHGDALEQASNAPHDAPRKPPAHETAQSGIIYRAKPEKALKAASDAKSAWLDASYYDHLPDYDDLHIPAMPAEIDQKTARKRFADVASDDRRWFYGEYTDLDAAAMAFVWWQCMYGYDGATYHALDNGRSCKLLAGVSMDVEAIGEAA